MRAEAFNELRKKSPPSSRSKKYPLVLSLRFHRISLLSVKLANSVLISYDNFKSWMQTFIHQRDAQNELGQPRPLWLQCLSQPRHSSIHQEAPTRKMKLFTTTTQSAAVVTAVLGAAQTSSALNADGVKFVGWGRSTQVADFVPNKCGYQEFSSSFVSAAESRFAYVSPSYWGLDSPCGRCAEVKLAISGRDPTWSVPNSTVTVMLISMFEDTTCPKVEFCQGNLLLSPQAYRELLNGASSSKVNLDWELVKCPENFVRGGVELAFGEAVNAKTLALQVRNFYGKIEGVEAKFEDGKTYVFQTMGDGSTGRARLQVGLPVDTTHAFTEPFTLVVKQSDTNNTIEVKFDHLPQPNEVVVTNTQFD